MSKCTWKNCQNEGKYPQIAKNSEQWAFLCDEHDKEIEDGILSPRFNPKRILRNWVLASGGAKEMIKRKKND